MVSPDGDGSVPAFAFTLTFLVFVVTVPPFGLNVSLATDGSVTFIFLVEAPFSYPAKYILMVAVPAPTAVIFPPFTVHTDVLEDFITTPVFFIGIPSHRTVAVAVWPFLREVAETFREAL